MDLSIYQVDAFTNKVFGGNSAAICPLKEWISDDVMQQIAKENAIAETAFFVASNENFEIRWFTPDIEMDLCGHATLAAAHVISRHLGYSNSKITFSSQSGELLVSVDEKLIHLDFPSRMPVACDAPEVILKAFQSEPKEILKARDYVLVYDDEAQVKNMQPDRNIFDQINLGNGGVIITAPGNDVDFVSRFFMPQASILEDPVTGSAHCSLIPYWAEKLSKSEMAAKQLSDRVGLLYCKNNGRRVTISGEAITYLVGTISI